LIEPEQKWDPEVELGLGHLGGLGTVAELHVLAAEGAAEVVRSSQARAGYSLETLFGIFLSHVSVPADHLVWRDEEFLVEILYLRVIFVERVTIDSYLHVVDERLSYIIYVCEKLLTNGGAGERARPIGGVQGSDASESKVENHIVEEVAELRDAELDRGSKSRRTALHAGLVIFITNPDTASRLLGAKPLRFWALY
jgi:hypothetical protein